MTPPSIFAGDGSGGGSPSKKESSLSERDKSTSLKLRIEAYYTSLVQQAKERDIRQVRVGTRAVF